MSSPQMLRRDLVVSRQETPEGPRFVLKEPRTQRYYRLREVEYAIARRLDGVTSLEDLAPALAVELDVELDASSLEAFVALLGRQGLLEDPSAPPPTKQGFVRGTPLYVRFRAFDPNGLLDWLIRRLRFLFTPYFVVGAAALILWAIVTVAANQVATRQDLARLWHFQSLFFAWLTILGVVTLHEFAHGLTCKHFGGKVHEMGFMLIYFQPAFYCNISDAWLFPRKSHRLWVTAAGAFFELFLWSMAVVVWRVAESGTWVSGLALIVMATSAFKQFFNLNPLLKMDGYYLLSDLLDVPNLRQRAFAYVAHQFRRLTGTLARSAHPEASARERAIFLAYGLAAFVFSYLFLAKVVLRMGAYLTARYQAVGLGLFVVFLGLVFPQPGRQLRRWLGATNRRAHRRHELTRPRRSHQDTTGPDESEPSSSEPSPASKWRRRTVWLLAVAGIVALACVVRVPLRVGGTFDLLPARNADVRATVEGVVEQVFVEEGDVVQAGDTIARLAEHDYRARLSAVEAEIGEKTAQLLLLRAGPRHEEVELARLAVAKAKERLAFMKAEAARTRDLAGRELVSRAELERAEEQVTVLSREVQQETARLDVLAAGSRPEAIAAMEQEVAGAEAERGQLQGEIARLVLTAPHGGVVTTPHVWEKVGEYVKRGDLVAEIHTIHHLTAEIKVSERDIGEVRVGQQASLRLRAYPNRTFTGTVTRIAAAAVDNGWRAERDVRVEVGLPNPENLLRPHMTGYARIHTGERRAIDVLTRRVRRFIRVEFWSWW